MFCRAHVVLLSCIAASVAFAQPADLLLYAPFDGSAAAALARGNAGNVDPGVFAFADTPRGKALELGAPCRYETAGNFSTGEGTVALWVQPHWNGDDPGVHYLFCLYGQRDLPQSWMTNRLSLYCAGGNAILEAYNDKQEYVAAKAPITSWRAGEWHHIAATWRGVNAPAGQKAQLTLYLDGVATATVERDSLQIGPQNNFFDIGNDQDNNPKPGNALAADLFIYSRALAADEIKTGVSESRGAGVPPATGPAPAARPVRGWWDTHYPFRTEVILPATDRPRRSAYVQTKVNLGGDLSALGLSAALDEGSLRLVEIDRKTGVETGPLPLRVEDGIAEWSAAGDTPANTPRRFRLYFRTADYTFPQPLVARRTTVAGELAPAPPQAPDYATAAYGKPWDFADDIAGIDQWGNKPDYIQNRKVENHILSMDVQEDPWFIWGDMWGQVEAAKRKVAIDLERFPVLEMKVRQSVPYAKWQLYGRVGKAENLLTYEWPVSGTGWQRLRVDLRQDARWKGVLSAFRIDPTQGVTAHVDIAWVRLIAANAGLAGQVETIGRPSGVPVRTVLSLRPGTRRAGEVSPVVFTVQDNAGRPISGQPVTIYLKPGSGGTLRQAGARRTLARGPQERTGLTDADGKVAVEYEASHRPGTAVDTLDARVDFAAIPEGRPAPMNVVAGPPQQFVVSPRRAVAVASDRTPVDIAAQVADEYGNPVASEGVPVVWSAPDAQLTDAATKTDATGRATAKLTPDYARRWVYSVSISGGGLAGRSGDICLISTAPRPNPVKLGANGMYQTADGKPWLALGGFYANWVGLPQDGEEGKRLVSFTDATEEQMVHWLSFLHDQGVTAMRFMLRTHRPNGMEPMDIGGRVNMDLFARALRYMDLARPFGIRFMLTIHEDYTKPMYYDVAAFTRFALPKWEGEDIDRLPPFQRRFIRDRKFLGSAAEKYTDPDAIACQDQYARQLVAMLRGNPQVFCYELENEMVDCPQSWANHAIATLRSADPNTLVCVSHGGGGLETADPLWWTRNTKIDFYTYHLYAYPGSVTPNIDYGCAVDILARYGRMAGVCQLGESAGDEFSLASTVPIGTAGVGVDGSSPEVRRYVMRDIIWMSLVNGNPGCFFWNARGYEVEQFRLASKVLSPLDFTTWRRAQPEIGIKIDHPLTDDKYYRSKLGHENHAMMGKYAQHYMSQGTDFAFTMDGTGPDGKPYARLAGLTAFTPPEPSRRLFTVTPGWQLRYNAREGCGEGFAYIRNFADIALWEVPGKAKMWLRTRKDAPLKVSLDLPIAGVKLVATDLDTGETKEAQLDGKGELDLGTSGHDWVLVWQGR